MQSYFQRKELTCEYWQYFCRQVEKSIYLGQVVRYVPTRAHAHTQRTHIRTRDPRGKIRTYTHPWSRQPFGAGAGKTVCPHSTLYT